MRVEAIELPRSGRELEKLASLAGEEIPRSVESEDLDCVSH